METNRDIKELLHVALDNFDEHFDKNGLCGYFCYLSTLNIISDAEEIILTDFIYDNKPNTLHVKKSELWFWEPYAKRPRKQYLIRMIKKLNK
jgi:hypothetical protein